VSDLLAYCQDVPTRTVPAGDLLMAEGSAPGPMFVLVSGTAAIERDGVPFARISHPGAVFGEMSVVLDQPVTATVRAESELVVHEIADAPAFLAERPGVALAVLRMTAERLDGMTRYLVDVKAQFAGLGGHLGMVDRILDTLVHHQAAGGRTGSARDPEGDHADH
jgi:CRP-like cAMP-binding protein